MFGILTFLQWLAIVDRWLDRTADCCIADLPDFDYRREFDAGTPATFAGKMALLREGWTQ
jgi:hypothetical protein